MVHQPTRVWVDLVSPSHPFFFAALLENLPNVNTETTVRNKTETANLARQCGFDFKVVGRDFHHRPLKIAGYPLRTLQLIYAAPETELSLCSRNPMCILASKSRRIPSIHFTDNDITAHRDGLRYERQYNRLESLATYNVVPDAFEIEELTQWHADPESVLTYNGYKEDVYVAGFEPDSSFTDKLPFEEFVVVRPEALDATYVDASDSLVPELLSRTVDRGFNIVYLPRGRGDEHFADGYTDSTVYCPDEALDGLELAWHSQCILTGSGTMAREAACMSKPAVSFFPNTLLSVDKKMVENNRMLHSREVDEIIGYLEDISKSEVEPDTSRSESVRNEVVRIVQDIIDVEAQ